MADLSYNVKVNTSDAQRSLSGLKTALGGLAAAFSIRETVLFADSLTNLQNKLRTISTDAGDVGRQFAAIAQIADSSRTSLEATGDLYFKIARSLDVLGISQQQAAILTDSISKGLVLSGASAAGAESAIYQLGQAFGSGVLRGEELNAVLENAPVLTTVLADALGVTVGELRKLGEQGKLTGDLVANAFINANNSLNESFAKTVPTVGQQIERLRTNFGRIFVEFENNTGAVGKLADAVGGLADAMAPLGAFIRDNGEGLATLGKMLAGAAVAYLALGRGMDMAKKFGDLVAAGFLSKTSVIKALVGAVTGLVFGFKNFGENLLRAVGLMKTSYGGLASLAFAANALFRVLLRFTGVVGVFYAVAEAVDWLLRKLDVNFQIVDQLGNAWDWLKEKLGFAADAQEELGQVTQDATAALSTQATETSRVVKLTAEQIEAIQRVTQGYRDSVEAQISMLRTSNQLISASDEQRRMTEALQAAETSYFSAAQDLQRQLTQARQEANGKESEAVTQLTAELDRLDKAYVKNGLVIRDLIVQQTELTQARKLDEFGTKQQQRTQDELIKLQRDMARGSMTEIEQKYFDIRNAADDAARAAIREEEARRGSSLSANEQEEYYRRARAGNEALINQTRRLYDENERIKQQSRTFAAGWQEAWRDYADSATNASQHAANVFRTATKGMEDALVGFVKTGKFEWRGFVSDILEQLLRAQIQQGIASLGDSLGLGNLFGTKGGAQGGGSGRGGSPTAPLFVQDVSAVSGLAGGGVMAQQQAAMAQQTQSMFSKMGEIMGTIGTYLSSAMGSIGKVISGLVGSLGGIMTSVMKGMGSALSGIGSMIMSLIRSIVSMFGGYFADGGVLPRGQFGIVGERGPEIITGPATVTPMSGIGGGTQVIYNINAVDARSFQQLLAQDPGLIFALTEQGRKSLAGSRR